MVNKKITLNVTGMHCASCSSVISKALTKVEGVNTVNVNLITEKAVIEFEDNLTNLASLTEVIKNKGYGVKEIPNNIKLNKNINKNDRGIFSENKIGLIITIVVLIIGSFFYFSLEPLNNVEINMTNNNNMSSNMSSLNPSIFNNMQIKVAYTPEGTIKLFAIAKNNDLSKLITIQGESIPEIETIVIGYDEANMMKEEKLFENTGDKIENLFGINITIGGIFNKTGTIIDEMHFISEVNYQKLDGVENKVFIKLNSENSSKVFYYYKQYPENNLKFELEEGNFENYKIITKNGLTYYPVIIGYNEAQMMKEEKLFINVDDTIDNFFGNNIIVVGIIKQTNTSLDMMHIIPLSSSDLI